MRLKTLDSVRGIAALIVVIYHSSLIFPHGGVSDQPLLRWSPLRLLVSGSAAVIVFFVLSGVVLTGTFIKRDKAQYLPYAAKRLVRIYAPFATTIFLSISLKLALDTGPVSGASGWLNGGTWEKPLTISMVIRTLLMDGINTHLNNPMWSLVHELRISLVFPLLVICTQRNLYLSLTISAIVSIACAAIVSHLPSDELLTSLVQTGTYVVMFVAGISLTLYSKPIRERLSMLSNGQHAVLWILALAGLAFSPSDASRITQISEVLLLLINTASAYVVLMLAITEGKAFTFLLGRIPVALGNISFSLYLTHVIILAAFVHGLPLGWPLKIKVLIGFAASFPVATAFYFLIERPTMRLSQALGARLTKRTLHEDHAVP